MDVKEYRSSTKLVFKTNGKSPQKRSKPVKTPSDDSNNDSIYDEHEQKHRKIVLQETCIALAQRATFILESQKDAEVLDFRPFASEMNDTLLNEIANQLRVNLSRLSKKHEFRQDASQAVFSTIILSQCDKISPVGMRSFVHAIGPTMRRLDYSLSAVSIDVLKVMATCIRALDMVNFSSCPTLLAESLREFISCCNRSVSKLDLSCCTMLNDDGLGWIAGALGPQGSLTQCCKLLSLDISYTTCISDRGLAYLGGGCRAIQFLNLEGLERISAVGVLKVVQGCRNLRVLSLKKCMQLTDATLSHIGKHGANLRSLNLASCYRMTSVGLHALVVGTPLLQSLNLEGCRNMREGILAAVAVNCLSLQVLNVNGCQEITENGLTTLAEHLPYVVRAQRYRGLEPKPDSTKIKFSVQQKTIQNSAALRVQSVYRGYLGRKIASTWRREVIEVPAVRRIRRNYNCSRLNREINRRVRRSAVMRRSAIKIQSLIRGVLCRAFLQRQEEEERRIVGWAKCAVRVQAVYRGHWTRRNMPLVFKTIQRFRLEQALLRREAAVTRLQRAYRKRYNRSRFEDVMAILRRQQEERRNAAVTLQRLFRTRASRKAYLQLREAMKIQLEKVRELVRYAIKLQSNWRGHCGRRNARKAKEEMIKRERHRYDAASRINAGVRGYFDRRIAQEERVKRQTRIHAVRVIQRAWRNYLTPSLKQIQFDQMIAKMKSQVVEEGLVASRKQKELLKKAKELFDRDSASEPESDDDWRDFLDDNGYQFWFSPSRNERHYVRPNDFAYQKSMLGMYCRVFWPLEQQWFNGRITRYNHAKNKHRIEYDDGDHEWLCVHIESDRVQLYNGFCWCIVRMFEPSMRTLKAAIYLKLRVQHYDHRYLGWRSGCIQAYNEQSDGFLVQYDDDGSGGGIVEEWTDLFRQEQGVQVQDAITLQWYSLSAYVFGNGQGRPLGILKQTELSSYYGIEDYLNYVEETGSSELVDDATVPETNGEDGEGEVTQDGEHDTDDEDEDDDEEDEDEDEADDEDEDDGDDESNKASEEEDEESEEDG